MRGSSHYSAIVFYVVFYVLQTDEKLSPLLLPALKNLL